MSNVRRPPWPNGDERGMGNIIGPETWMRCAVHLGDPGAKCYELAHPISSTMPMSPYCRPLNLSLCEECQAYNAQFTRPIAAIRCLFDRDLIVFDAASYDETVTTLEELHEAATDPKVKTALGKLLYLANQMPLLSETELGKQITKLF